MNSPHPSTRPRPLMPTAGPMARAGHTNSSKRAPQVGQIRDADAGCASATAPRHVCVQCATVEWERKRCGWACRASDAKTGTGMRAEPPTSGTIFIYLFLNAAIPGENQQNGGRKEAENYPARRFPRAQEAHLLLLLPI